MQWLRRLLLAGLLAAFGIILYGRFVRERPEQPGGPAEWPPFAPSRGAGPAASGRVAPLVEPPPAVQSLIESPPVLTESPAVLTEAPEILSDHPPATGDIWVRPLADGGCPAGYPVKANDNSGIYHLPGGRFYERTRAERCYARAEDAETDGYRRAKA